MLRSWPWSPRTSNELPSSTSTRRRSSPGRKGRSATRGPSRSGRFFGSEALEPRMLLTTLVGGESFDYLDNSLPGDQTPGTGQLVRVTLSGNIRAEIVGAAVTNTNQA